MAAYLVTAWLLVQIADVILPIYGAPPWVLRTIATLLVLGFTPVIIFSWLFNITRHGIESTAEMATRAPVLSTLWFRGAIGGVTLAFTLIAIWWVWTDYLSAASVRIKASGRLPGNPVVAVTPLRNLSGKAELEWLGEGLANLVRTELGRSRHVVVVSKTRWQSIVRRVEPEDEVLAAARDAGIQYVFSGEFISAPAGLFLAVRLTDLSSGIDIASKSYPALRPEMMLANGYRLSILAKQGLHIPHTESIDSFAADFVVNNMTAYEAYVGGLEFFRRFAYEDAENSMNAALTLAPNFHVARYRLAHIFMSTGRQSQATETIQAIPDDAGLTQRERLYIEAAKSLFEYDLETAIDVYKQLLAEYPYEVEARQFLAEAYFQNYQDELAVDELKILARQEPENEFIWGSMGTFLILSGRLEEAREPLETYLSLAAEKAHPLTMLGDLSRQKNDYEKASAYYSKALEASPGFAEARRGNAQVLTILGESEAAKAIWHDVTGNSSIPADERIYAAFDFASVLRSEGRFSEAIEILELLSVEIEEEKIRESMALSTRALSHMELGELEIAGKLIAQAIERNKSAAPTRYLFARGLLELRKSDFAGALETAAEILGHALPPDDPDRTEERAASWLKGMAFAGQGDAPAAVETLTKALGLEGYDYAIYELGLSTVLTTMGRFEVADQYAEHAVSYRNASEVRLDLELDRARAKLLQALIQQRLGNHEQARILANDFLDRWSKADLPHPDIDTAQKIVSDQL